MTRFMPLRKHNDSWHDILICLFECVRTVLAKSGKKNNNKKPKCLKKKICYTAAKIALGDKS